MSLSELLERREAVVLGVSKDPNAKLTALLFSGGRSPDTVAKIATTPMADEAVRREWSTLQRIRAALDDAEPGQRLRTSHTVPEPIELCPHVGRWAMVTTALPGRPLLSLYNGRGHTASPERVAGDFAAVGEWIAAFQAAVCRTEYRSAPSHSVVERLGSRFAPELGALAEHAATVTARLSEVEPLIGATGRRGVSHGDLWLGNVLVADGRVVGVVDWEAARFDEPSWRDPVHFALNYALYLDRRTGRGRRVRGHPGLRASGWGAGLLYALDGRGWFPELFRGFVRRAARCAGVPAEHWRDLVVLDVADIAVGADHPEFATSMLRLLVELVAPSSRPRPAASRMRSSTVAG